MTHFRGTGPRLHRGGMRRLVGIRPSLPPSDYRGCEPDRQSLRCVEPAVDRRPGAGNPASGTFAVACPFSTVLSELGAQLKNKSRPPVSLVVTAEKAGVTSQTAQIEKMMRDRSYVLSSVGITRWRLRNSNSLPTRCRGASTALCSRHQPPLSVPGPPPRGSITQLRFVLPRQVPAPGDILPS